MLLAVLIFVGLAGWLLWDTLGAFEKEPMSAPMFFLSWLLAGMLAAYIWTGL